MHMSNYPLEVMLDLTRDASLLLVRGGRGTRGKGGRKPLGDGRRERGK